MSIGRATLTFCFARGGVEGLPERHEMLHYLFETITWRVVTTGTLLRVH